MDAQKAKQITDVALAVGSMAEATSPNLVIPVEIAKIGMLAYLNYLAVAGLTTDQIEAAYQAARAQFLSDDPNKIIIAPEA